MHDLPPLSRYADICAMHPPQKRPDSFSPYERAAAAVATNAAAAPINAPVATGPRPPPRRSLLRHGEFAGSCSYGWSSFTVPVGAGVGAIVGYGVKRMRRSVTAVPVFSRKAAAVVVTARF
jgi:hypothetical protein